MRLTPSALAFIAELVRAKDPADLYAALGAGFKSMFPHSFAIATFHFVRGGGFTSIWRSVSVPEPGPEYWARLNAMHPAFPFVRARPGLPVCSMSDVVPDAEVEKHPIYEAFMVPERWRFALALLVWDRGELVGIAGMARRPDQGDFTIAERSLATALQPFLVAAWARIADQSADEDARKAQEVLISSLPLAALIYSARTGKVLFHNRASRDALARWHGEATRKRPRSVTTAWLPQDIVAACERVPRSGTDVRCQRAPLRASLRGIQSRAHFESGVVLIVIVEEDRAVAAPSARWLDVARTLSPAEQRVAGEALAGRTNVEIADRLGKSPGTVKKQLEGVFKKAGVTGRSALGALYSGFAPPRVAGSSTLGSSPRGASGRVHKRPRVVR